MPTNDFVTVADGGSANVLSQSAYLALTSYLANGFGSGIVPSNQMNKTLRQASVMAYVLAQHIANFTGLDVLDNGNAATVLSNLATAVRNTTITSYAGNPNGHVAGVAGTPGSVAPTMVWDTVNKIFWVCTTTGNAAAAVWYADTGGAGSTYCGTATGTANTIVLTPAVPVPAYGGGLGISFIVGTTNTGATTVNVSGLGAVNLFKESPTGPIALTGGELVAGNLVSARHDGTRFQLTATELGTAALANASSGTGTLAAVSGSITVGHLAVFGDTAGTVQDGGLPGTAAAPTHIDASFNGQTLGSGVYNVDTKYGGGAFTTLLPASPTHGQSLGFNDQFLWWDIANFTIGRNGHTIMGSATDLICNVKGLNFQIVYDATLTDWRLE